MSASTDPDPLKVNFFLGGASGDATTTHNYNDYITNVNFAGINNSTDPSLEGGILYTDYGRSPNQIAAGEVTKGVEYPISITINGDDDIGTTDNVTIDPGEEVLVWTNQAVGTGYKTLEGHVTIPTGAVTGKIYSG